MHGNAVAPAALADVERHDVDLIVSLGGRPGAATR
jgi:hypothetical protein